MTNLPPNPAQDEVLAPLGTVPETDQATRVKHIRLRLFRAEPASPVVRPLLRREKRVDESRTKATGHVSLAEVETDTFDGGRWTVMKTMIAVLAVCGLMVLQTSNAEDVRHCVNGSWEWAFSWEDEEGKKEIHLTNSCAEVVTVFICSTGSARPHVRSKVCGNGANYYTHSKVIPPGKTVSMGSIRKEDGDVEWATCRGNYGFGSGGFSADSTGAFTCGSP